LRRIALVCSIVITALVVGTAGLFATWLSGRRIPLASGATYMRVEKLAGLETASAINGGPGAPFFILLVGSDLRPGIGGSRGDALHLLGVNPELTQATMLDIPRDTCWHGSKINAANTRGLRSSADAVGGLIGVPVAYVVEVDFAGFTSLVDGVGGVDVNVPVAMDDHYSGAVFSQGMNHMSGQQALAFSRNRHQFPNSDITRTNNQGRLILDAMRQLQKKSQSAAGEFQLLALLGRHARLDGLGVKDLYQLGRLAFSLKPDQIKNITIPIGGGSCLSLGSGSSALFADFRDDAVVQTAG
jgi:polyisoprenyl-teichoic acid--peptidoglycan teichoic acid transferase